MNIRLQKVSAFTLVELVIVVGDDRVPVLVERDRGVLALVAGAVCVHLCARRGAGTEIMAIGNSISIRIGIG